jgi:hypothetical protein
MSQYIKFILDRFGVSHIRRLIILQNDRGWANQQIVDEFKAVFPEIEIKVMKNAVHVDCDMIVLPYMDDVLREQPGGMALYHHLRSAQVNWVMLYGLAYRTVDVMQAKDLLPYFMSSRRTSFFISLLKRFHLLNLAYRLQRWKISL